MSPPDLGSKTALAGIAGVILFALGLFQLYSKPPQEDDSNPGIVQSLLRFCYSCFLKPHSAGTKGTQQDALESFYSSQASIYDVTRKTLLKGREDMLALVAAQLKSKAEKDGESFEGKRVWVDVSFQYHLDNGSA